jgi:hypothetical protein
MTCVRVFLTAWRDDDNMKSERLQGDTASLFQTFVLL